MENASKALLMAGGVLLGILILSLAVYLFSNFGGASSRIHDNIEENQTAQFNSQFTKYVGNENVTIHDVVTMANLATENNKYYEMPKRGSIASGSDNYITVLLDGIQIEYGYGTVLLDGIQIEYGYGNSQSEITQRYNNLLSAQVDDITATSSELKKYNVQVETSDITKRVYIVRCSGI